MIHEIQQNVSYEGRPTVFTGGSETSEEKAPHLRPALIPLFAAANECLGIFGRAAHHG